MSRGPARCWAGGRRRCPWIVRFGRRRQATGQQRLFGTPPGRKRETGRHCGASSRQRRTAGSLRWRHGSKPVMNVTLKPFDFAQAVARAGLGTDGIPLAKGPAAAPDVGFQKALSQALGAVSKTQNDATAMQREVSLDNPTVSLEQTMVAMQKAQIGFAATLQVRNRLVQAYSEIMSMQV